MAAILILSAQEGYNFGSKIKSDVAPLNNVVMKLLNVGGIVSMKDPTQGGLSNSLNEWSEKSIASILLREASTDSGRRESCLRNA